MRLRPDQLGPVRELLKAGDYAGADKALEELGVVLPEDVAVKRVAMLEEQLKQAKAVVEKQKPK